ncbi:MAG: hypothetical protein BroJett006_16010 [Betaproteobacteria bacterium]|nr:MAG: hypothetical protein BroJett006_16010 [Betaproteobacteria bacterium]
MANEVRLADEPAGDPSCVCYDEMSNARLFQASGCLFNGCLGGCGNHRRTHYQADGTFQCLGVVERYGQGVSLRPNPDHLAGVDNEN